MLQIEDAKIALSNAVGENARLADDLSTITVPVLFEKGSLHPDQDIEAILGGEDLRAVIRKMWRKYYGRIIIETVNEAEQQLSKSRMKLEQIDKVLVAGGSSRLPFMREEIVTVLPTRVRKESIFVGGNVGAAVAFGIAAECRERIKKYPELSVNKLAPCLLTDLYLAFRKTRRDPFLRPKIDFEGSVNRDGRLTSKPCELEGLTLDYEVDMPFEVKERVFYGFFDQPVTDERELVPINVVNDVFSVRSSGKIARRCQLKLEIKQNGMIKPTFYFREEGKNANRKSKAVECTEFYSPDLKVNEGYPFLGIDFGTSNSYVARFLSPPQDIKAAEYPDFFVQDIVLERLRQIELLIRRCREEGILRKDTVLAHAIDKKLLMVFHSNKIEGNPLTIGETSAAIETQARAELSKREREAFNLEKAYMWTVENSEFCRKDPEAFIRQINGMILNGIETEAGKYRKKPIEISGMDFIPPHSASVEAFMEMLGKELKGGPGDRSIIEFAASIHTKLVYIHPFVDANGRTARLLMNAILLEENLPAIIVNYDDKQRYLDALSKCSAGDISSLVVLFTEYFSENIEEVKNQVLIEKEQVGKVESSVPVSPVVKSESRKEDPVREALREVRAGPLRIIMHEKIEHQKRLEETNYEAWRQAFSLLASEFKSLVEAFNADEEYQGAGFRIRLFEYDILSFDKYRDISHQKKASKTWFLGFQVESPNASIRILFFFEHASSRITAKRNASKVSLVLALSNDSVYQRLTSEPISLREIGFADGELFCLHAERGKTEGTVGFILENLLAEVIKSYL